MFFFLSGKGQHSLPVYCLAGQVSMVLSVSMLSGYGVLEYPKIPNSKSQIPNKSQ
jgi:hypothetical protein